MLHIVRLLLLAKLSLCLLLLLPGYGHAATDHEIAHLLQFVEQSECLFLRNNTRHEPAEARKHIEKKYDHYREKIESTEDFIAYSATKSMLSGKRYRVICDGVEQTAAEWLLSELHAYRARTAGATP